MYGDAADSRGREGGDEEHEQTLDQMLMDIALTRPGYRLVDAGEADLDWQRRQQGKKSQRQVAEPVLQQVLTEYPEGDRQALRNQARNLIKARPADPDAADADQRARFKRERKRFQSLLNDLEKNAPLY